MNELLLSAYTNKVIEQNNELKKQLEAYENMRKELIKTIHETDNKPPHYYELKSDLLNILNKVGEDNETI